MNFSRKTILVVGAALLAACGDKVTVSDPYIPPTPPAKVNFVEVTPATATVSTGGAITFTAAVNADAGLATTVTWSASAGTVTAAGVFTAPATSNPGISVCATSTVDTGKKGCATVVVSPAPATFPATVSIASTTTGALNVPVNPLAVAGQMDVTLNINPGTQVISKVELLVGGKVACSQTFTAAQSAALRFAADEAVAAQTTFPQIVCSVNTADYSTTTGMPTWLNGTQTMQAKVYTVSGGSSAAASASVTQNLVFANVDGFHITHSNTGTPGSAVDAAGYRWNGGGSLTVKALPVMYSGSAVGTVAAALGANGACPAVGAIGTATALTGSAYEITGTMAGLQSAAACATTTPNLITITATSAAGDNLTLAGTGVLNVQSGLRWDNVAPVGVAGSTFAGSTGVNMRLNVNPNGRANGWINDAVVLNGAATSATSNNYLCSASAAGFNTCAAIDTLPRDAGVGGAVYTVQVGATKADAYTAPAITSAAALAATATNAGYCAIAFSTDALGNKTTLTTAQKATACGTEANNALIGVDRAAPTIAYDAASIAANARLFGGSVGGEYVVAVNDTGLVGNSGMLPTAPVKMTISRRAAGTTANSAGTVTLRDATGAATVTALSATGVASLGAGRYSSSFTGITGAANHAYWTHNATAWDAAGNSASVSPRVMVYDATAAVPGVPSAPLSISAIGYTANAFVNEDLDIQDFSFDAIYGGVPVTLGQPWNAVNGFNASPFANTNYAITSAINFPLALQANVAAGLFPVTGLTTTARSQSNLLATSGAFAPTTVTPGAAISTTNMATFGVVTLPAGVTGVVTGNTTAAAAATPASALLTVTSTGTTAIYNNPFARVDFYMVDASGTGRVMLVGSATTPVLNDNGAIRTFTWTTTINGATVYSLLNGAGAGWASQVSAIGVAADGKVAMLNQGPTGINVVF